MAYIGRDTDKISNVEVLDNITFDGSSSYTLQKNSVNFIPSSANTLLVSIDGVVQAGNFTVSGSTIDFGTAVAGTSTCDFILHYGVGLITTPADGTVTSAKISYPLTTFSSTGIDDNATSTAITIDSSEKVGIGTSSPDKALEISGTNNISSTLRLKNTAPDPDNIWDFVPVFNSGDLTILDDGTEHMRIDSSGNLKFNSGYGSVATAYGCRAWVSFDGEGTVFINDSGNVSSITDGGVGIYTVNFTTNMPDANYSAVATPGDVSSVALNMNASVHTLAVGSYIIRTRNVTTSAQNDRDLITSAVFR